MRELIFFYIYTMQINKAIITALQAEADRVIEKYSLWETKQVGSLKIFSWTRKNTEDEEENIILCVCSEGKIQSAFATTYLLENYEVEKIINIGIVGNLNSELLKVGDVIMPNTFVQHDFYMPEDIDFQQESRAPIFLEYAIGEEYDLEKFSLHLSGICATGDQFIDKMELMEDIRTTFEADIVDMEAYSILSVVRNYNMLDKCVVIKSVSDGADSDAQNDVMNNLELAMQNAIIILDFVL